MGVENRKVTRGPTGKTYNWTRYHCKRDDVWADVEIPKEEEGK